ncbi:NADPH:quinone reductase [Lentibacillus sp. JNUCC-1]|uniref:alcohol dehydrogenase catalytic domain-containing protein n=1 Tax=Lentibacillus sp. JNUCC-1 TaxID=2654513 RepID=UPI0012E81B9B|nr:alcohol dehydrogenase catalytic domain-containing protein [Lentibacillus sp. JNUCC-1]MUV36439.1 NADPH:quinone reductase [Lentibacillus sp. JNUCC-1]
MKAIVMEEYGDKDVLNYTDIKEPELKANDVLIEIKATSVNPVDWQIRAGYLQQAIPYEFPLIIGWDAAGVVKKVGSDVTKFSVGDEVFSSPDMMRNGTYAEYVAVDVFRK